MERIRRRAAGFVGVLASVIAAMTFLYRWGMITFESRTPSLARSLRFVVETMTTVGYGTEATWESATMELLVTGMMIIGVVFFFLSLPLLVIPLIEAALSTTPPTEVAREDHVVLCGFSGRAEAFLEELDAWDTDYVVVEPDAERAAALHEAGYTVVHGDPESTADLAAASAPAASAIVADIDDETNASIALTCRELPSNATVIAFAKEPANAEYIRLAGADEVLTPRHMLGQSLAEKVTSSVRAELDDVVELGAGLEMAELPVEIDSEIAGLRLSESAIREQTGVDIIGAWHDGEFDPTPDPSEVLEPGIILLVAGQDDQLDRLRSLTRTETRSHARGRVIVGGYGEVGRTVASSLAAAEVPYTVVDVEDAPGVDVVGDISEVRTLEAADVQGARAVVLALPEDTSTVFATLVLREFADDVEIVARGTDPENVRKLYLADADYVLSLSTVSGRMLASLVLDEHVIAPDKQVDIVRCPAPALAGQTLGEADVRARTGTTVIAVERDGELHTELDAAFEIAEGDELVVAGSDDGITKFNKLARD